jgi:peptidoglycan hydrolase-like protein with peptidoglycan-binding domain
MAVITQTIQAGEQNNAVTEVQHALISLGATIAPDERATATAAGTFGPSTQAAVTALLARFGSQPPSPFAFSAMAGRLLNIAVGAELGNSAGLRQAIRESFSVIQTAPAAELAELAWLSRYATVARDFTTARAAIELIPDERSVPAAEKQKIAAIVKPSPERASNPEILNPENYYTVKYGYVPRNAIDAVIEEP